MVFADKLKMIMQLTQTTNSRLAAAINVDPSLISRLKSGDRFVSSKSDYLYNMAEYFGSKCNDSFRSLTVLEILGAEFGEDIVIALEKWFLDESVGLPKENISDFYRPLSENKKKISKDKYCYFNGKDALSRAAEYVNDLAEQNDVKVIKILSDCNKGKNSVELFECCRETLIRHMKKGTEIVRVMPNFTDMSCAVNDIISGFSILEEGKLESYYYHNFKEGVFNNRLLVVPGVAAMISESVSESGVEPTIVIADKKAISDYEKLFDEYIGYCTHGIRTKPIRILNETLNGFFDDCDDFCNIYGKLPLNFIAKNRYINGGDFIADHMKKILATNNVTEVFSLIRPEEFDQADNAVQYKRFLSETVKFLENEPRYNVIILPETGFLKGNVFLKRNGEAVYLPNTPSETFGFVSHRLSVDTLWQYFTDDARYTREQRKRKSVEEIKACIETLR